MTASQAVQYPSVSKTGMANLACNSTMNSSGSQAKPSGLEGTAVKKPKRRQLLNVYEQLEKEAKKRELDYSNEEFSEETIERYSY